MLIAAALAPGAPLVVPALSGPGATDVIDLRTATLEVGRRLGAVADRWIAVGVADPETAVARTGTFAGFGVDVRVALDPDTGSDGPDLDTSTPRMSAPMLVAGWIRGQTAAPVTISPVLVAPATTTQQCVEMGTAVGRQIAESDTPVGLLVIGDGSFGLTAGAPGGAIDGAPEQQSLIDAAIAAADLAALVTLDPQTCHDLGISGRAAWQVAAAIWRAAADGEPPVAESLYCAAPFGVGYQVAWWSR